MVEFLYKYRSVDQYSEKMLREGEVYFANPTQFNDPFDCKFSISIDATTSEIKRYLRRMHRSHNIGGSVKEREVGISAFRKRLRKNPKAEESKLKAALESRTETIGIYSLSEVPDDILMWSHYSSNHKGFCMKFVNSKECRFMKNALQIDYSENYPAIMALSEPGEDQVKKALLTKSKHWSYEREWRIIRYEQGFGMKRFPTNALSGVIFGCKMPEEDRRKIASWCEGRPNKVTYYEAKQSKSKYVLEITEILSP